MAVHVAYSIPFATHLPFGVGIAAICSAHLHILEGNAYRRGGEANQAGTCTNRRRTNNYFTIKRTRLIISINLSNCHSLLAELASATPQPNLLTSTNISFEGTNNVIQPFSVGLQMVSGDAMRRTPPANGDLQHDPSEGPIQPAQFGCGHQNWSSN
jgi:hypothetical protein